MSGSMPMRRIGTLEVSLLGLGCNNFGGRIDAERTDAVVAAALDAGVNFFDTADLYGGTHSEELLARALGPRRDSVLVATKFGMPVEGQGKGASPAYVRQAVEASLRRLQTDHIDLYQLHRPDPATPIADTLAAMDDLVKEGKVREIGCSNFCAAELREARAAVADGAAWFVSVQNEYSLLHREPEDEVLPECERSGTAFIPYYPLAAGVLTGKYVPGEAPPAGTRMAGLAQDRVERLMSPANMAAVQALRGFAEQRGRSILDLAIAWLAAKPVIGTVIAGATRPEQVAANASAIGWAMSDDDVVEVDRLLSAG